MKSKKNFSIFLTILLALLVVINIFPTVSADEQIVSISSEEELKNTLSAMTSESNITIKLEKDLTFNENISIKDGSVTLLGEGHTIAIKEKFNGINVSGSATLNLGKKGYEGILVISGDKTQDDSLVYIGDSAILNMYDGVTIQNGMSSNNASAVQLNNAATFNMYGGIIKDCEQTGGENGTAIVLEWNSIFNMYGGTIKDCSSPQGQSGAVLINTNGTFNMHGGEITNCSSFYAGAIISFYNGKLNIDGGYIHDNTGKNYGAIALLENSQAVISGGETTANKAGKYGGGIFLYGTGVSLDLKAEAAIWDNKAGTYGDDILNMRSNLLIEAPSAILNKKLTNTDNGHIVTGWYEDDSPRWISIHDEPDEMYMFEGEDFGERISGATFGMKAAHGEVMATINYKYVGVVPSNIKEPESENIEQGKKYTSKKPDTVENWKFNGWFTDEEMNKPFTDESEITENTTLYGSWHVKYQVEHWIQDIENDGYTLKEAIDGGYVNVGDMVNAKINAYEHYTYNEAASNASGKVTAPILDENGKMKVFMLKLYYDLEKIDITYNTNGGEGTGEYSTKHIPYGSFVTIESAPVKEGYNFKGWNTEEDGTGTVYNSGDKMKITNDTILYAQWEKIPEEPVVPDDKKEDEIPDESQAENIEEIEEDKTPKTGDKAIFYLGVLIISIVGFKLQKNKFDVLKNN